MLILYHKSRINSTIIIRNNIKLSRLYTFGSFVVPVGGGEPGCVNRYFGFFRLVYYQNLLQNILSDFSAFSFTFHFGSGIITPVSSQNPHINQNYGEIPSRYQRKNEQ